MPRDSELPIGNEDKTSLFPDTRWSLVLKMQGEGSETAARRALGDLCQSYWYPIYGFARSRGLSPHDAEDSTQSFFQRLLANESLDGVAAERGRLRGFFLASMKNFLATQWRSERALKRGGRAHHVSIDRDWAEGSLGDQFGDTDAEPDALFDRSWAYSLLNSVSKRLEGYYESKGKSELYEAIKGCLEGDGSYDAGADLAERLGMSPEGVRSAVFKLRRRFRDYIQEEVADTCSNSEDAHAEIAHLCKILAQ